MFTRDTRHDVQFFAVLRAIDQTGFDGANCRVVERRGESSEQYVRIDAPRNMKEGRNAPVSLNGIEMRESHLQGTERSRAPSVTCLRRSF